MTNPKYPSQADAVITLIWAAIFDIGTFLGTIIFILLGANYFGDTLDIPVEVRVGIGTLLAGVVITCFANKQLSYIDKHYDDSADYRGEEIDAIESIIEHNDSLDQEALGQWSSSYPSDTEIWVLWFLGIGYPIIAAAVLLSGSFLGAGLVIGTTIAVVGAVVRSSITVVRPLTWHLSLIYIAVTFFPAFFLLFLLLIGVYLLTSSSVIIFQNIFISPLYIVFLFVAAGTLVMSSSHLLLIAFDAGSRQSV
jgi:hypothetical protein